MPVKTIDQRTLFTDIEVVQRIFTHIDNATTDLGKQSWKEPTDNYRSKARLAAELKILQSRSIVFCPSSALPNIGDYIAREAANVPLIVVRGLDGVVRGFRNACRHRGVKLADGKGCARALVCPYHGWAYSLNGNLLSIPHEAGFPDVDKVTRGLVIVACVESNGLIFINQNPQTNIERDIEKGIDKDIEQGIGAIPQIIPDDCRLVRSASQIVKANWKLYLESSLEGYHIRQTHRSTFYPVQYDNLTVVEAFGENSRVTFPYQSIEGLRHSKHTDISVDGRLTYVYHLFPNVVISTFPGCIQVNVLEPIDETTTEQHTYLVSAIGENDTPRLDAVNAGQEFAAKGANEDIQIVLSAQQGLASNANAYLEFGLFESAIVRLHTHLAKELERVSEAKGQT